MFVEFEGMPDDSRVWVYQADRDFSESDQEDIYRKCRDFLTQWTAHGSGLKSSCAIFFNRFLIICVDEKLAMASGCSIDASVHFIQILGKELDTDFFDRTKIAFLDRTGDKVIIESLNNIKNNLTVNTIDGQSMTFNNLIQKKSDLKARWIIPAAESWMKKYFAIQKV